MPPTKDQTSIGHDAPTVDASDGASIETADGSIVENRDMARQEFAAEADINVMLSRFGVAPARGAPTYGEWDDTLDLQQAIASVTEARAAYAELPPELRNKFSSMDDLLRAYNNGSLVIKDGEVPPQPKSETEILTERINDLQKRLDAAGNPKA